MKQILPRQTGSCSKQDQALRLCLPLQARPSFQATTPPHWAEAPSWDKLKDSGV